MRRVLLEPNPLSKFRRQTEKNETADERGCAQMIRADALIPAAFICVFLRSNKGVKKVKAATVGKPNSVADTGFPVSVTTISL